MFLTPASKYNKIKNTYSNMLCMDIDTYQGCVVLPT